LRSKFARAGFAGAPPFLLALLLDAHGEAIAYYELALMSREDGWTQRIAGCLETLGGM